MPLDVCYQFNVFNKKKPRICLGFVVVVIEICQLFFRYLKYRKMAKA